VHVEAALYGAAFARRRFLNQQARGQTTRIVARRDRAGLSLRCDIHVAKTKRSTAFSARASASRRNTIKRALQILHS
jgi:hypothetical protein